MNALRISGISKRYGAQTVLDRLALEVAPGALVALLGPSGTGKSTLLKLIAGIDTPDAGTIALGATDLLALPAHRRNTVMMFQDAYLFPFLSVAENIAFGLRARKTPAATIRSEVARMLELVELPGYERRMPAELSGGQQQRVALARALIVGPAVLLLDEPLSNLDPAIRAALQQVIRRTHDATGVTTLLVTHDLGEAITLADKVALLLDARLAAYADPATIFERPPTRAAAAFVGVGLLIDGEQHGDIATTPLGPLRVKPAPPPGPVTLAIRPERMVLGADPAAPNAFPARVTAATYRGEALDYTLEANGLALRARAFLPGPRYAPGEEICVSLPPEALFAVAEDAPKDAH